MKKEEGRARLTVCPSAGSLVAPITASTLWSKHPDEKKVKAEENELEEGKEGGSRREERAHRLRAMGGGKAGEGKLTSELEERRAKSGV